MILIYSTDAWHSHDSKVLIGITNTKTRALQLIKPHIKKLAKELYKGESFRYDFDSTDELTNSLMEELAYNNQTQGYTENFSFCDVKANVLDIDGLS